MNYQQIRNSFNDLQQQREKIQEELEDIKKEKNEYTSTIQQLQEINEKQKKEIVKLKYQLEKLKKEEISSTSNISILDNDYSISKPPSSPILQGQILDLNSRNEELQKQVQGLQEENENLIQQLREKQSKVTFSPPTFLSPTQLKDQKDQKKEMIDEINHNEDNTVQQLVNHHKQLEADLQAIKHRQNLSEIN